MSVKGNSVAIQLWDTAGQERFRSITRHYFRKSDAVIVVYDVTSEKSFLSVRNWMTSIEVSLLFNLLLYYQTDVFLLPVFGVEHIVYSITLLHIFLSCQIIYQ